MMGGIVIEEVRPGVQFVPDAAASFRRAEAQVRKEFHRDIDVNSTYRSRAVQLSMYLAWERYVNGTGPYPGHSKALHPDNPLAFHVAGTAVDSDDWRNARIVEILAENGFIRNRLYVKNEEHHFEWLRNRDQHYGQPAGGGTTTPEQKEQDMNFPVLATSDNKTIWIILETGKKRKVTPVEMDVYRALAQKRGVDINDYIAEGIPLREIPNA